MWELDNQTPFAAERAWVRDVNGAEVWIVAVKGTFTIHSDGTTHLAKKQEEVSRVPVYRGVPGESSLVYESDLVRTKTVTDILLHGHAHALHGEPTRQIDVTLKVAGLNKTLRVFGDRRWDKTLRGVVLSPAEAFVTMPLIYERAYGGIDRQSEDPKRRGWESRNPIGSGFATSPQHLPGKLAPNVELPGALIRSWDHRPAPAGFGPIPRDWTPRSRLAGTYDDTWFNTRRPLLPLDFDNRFYQSASEDQRLPFLRGGEVVELTNLTPDGFLRFHLPRVVIGFTTRIANDWRHHFARLHTVVVEPDFPRVTLVWQTALECHPDVYSLRTTHIFQKQRLWPGPPRSTVR